MARRVKNTSAKSGQTAADRRLLAGATAITPAPTVKTDGYLLEQNEFIHLLGSAGGTTPVFRIRIWWYSQISGEWHRGRQVVFSDTQSLVTIETQGLHRVFLQVELTPSGVSPTLDLWVALVRPV